MTLNTSKYSIAKTATTNSNCAAQRALNLKLLFDSKKVLELCVGPSINTLKKAYREYKIEVKGNDIDSRYLALDNELIIGDCLSLDYEEFDTVVFAPPLSKGCSGRREDSLNIEEVAPSYYSFIDRVKTTNINFVLTLSGKVLSLKEERNSLFKLLNYLYRKYSEIEVIPLTNKKVNKYVDVYVKNK